MFRRIALLKVEREVTPADPPPKRPSLPSGTLEASTVAALAVTDGGKSLEHLLRSFVHDAPILLADIELAAGADALMTIQHAAHDLGCLGRTIGAGPLTAECGLLNQAVEAGAGPGGVRWAIAGVRRQTEFALEAARVELRSRGT